ncbi:hypothetical protein CDAR_369651 [Caerostris darwini]|uniref:C2H2-type domain-containing protein n=1 Tax=Caerostris darwini TaxID=1538125 RepID=A0AAV4V3L4_9ARAC|nr:hypothetical protein CDAR_369651 [Caerostris darwini]
MAIWNCEFCNAYVTDFEVHYCRNFRNQNRQSSATLPRSSSDNLVEDIDSRSTLPMNYDAGWPAMGQINSSTQQSVLPNIHQRTSCEMTANAEIPSPYGNANHSQYNPDISDFMFPNMAHGQENPSKSTPFTVADQQNLLLVSEPCSLPGFQQTFGRRNELMKQIAQRQNASSQLQCSGIYNTKEISSHFISDFNENFNTSANLILQDNETSSGKPILADQNTQYNSMDPILPIDAIGPFHSNKCPDEFLPKDHLETRESSRSVAGPHACNYCDKTFSSSSHLTRHTRTHTGETPYACTVCNKLFNDVSNLVKHTRTHTGKKSYACNKCTKRYYQNSSLKRHMLKHAGEDGSKCDSCGAEFASEESLGAHQCGKNN